jgi:multidrug efflux pump subunit AcrA (membrane-fusion protein)
MKGKKGTTKKVIGFFVVLLVAAGFVFLPSLFAEHGGGTGQAPGGLPGSGGPGGPGGRPSPGGFGANAADTVFSIRTAEAVIRNLQAYIEVNGNIINANQIEVNPDMGGKLESVRVALGSTVRKGEVIAYVDPSKPGSSYSLSPVIAPASGTLVGTPLTVGSTVSTASTIATIAGSDGLEIETYIPEREVGQLREGLKADITLAAFPGETFAAVVTTVFPIVDSNSRTKKILLKLVKQDSRINAGMFARVKLNTRIYESVVAVPAEALVELRGINGVYALEEGGEQVHFREVMTGATVDGETEIRTGLETGMAVVIQGQQFLTDGAKVRVIGRSI